MADDLHTLKATVSLRDKIASLPEHERAELKARSDALAEAFREYDAALTRLAAIRVRPVSRYAHLDPKCSHCGSDLDDPGCSECDPEAHLERRGAFRRWE